MNKYNFSIIAALVIFSSISGSAYAVSGAQLEKWEEQESKWRNKFKKSEELVVSKENTDELCKGVRNNVQARWKKYSDIKLTRIHNYDNGLQVLDKRIDFYMSQGFDSQDLMKLKADRVRLEDLITAYRDVYSGFLISIGEVKALPCRNYGDDDFITELNEAKEGWAEVKLAADAVKDFYKSDVKPEMQALNAQISDKVKEMETQ